MIKNILNKIIKKHIKSMTQEEKAKAYDKALEKAKQIIVEYDYDTHDNVFMEIFPELKESKDEWIKSCIGMILTDANETRFNEFNNTLFNGFHITLADCLAWLEKRGESKSAGKMQVSEKLYEYIRNTCACIDDALSSETLADVKDYLSQANYDAQSAFDMIEKQGEQKPADKVEPKFHEGDWVIDKQGFVYQIANVVENVTNHTYGYDIVGGGYFNDNNEDVRLWTIQDAKDGDVLASELCDSIILFRGIKDNNVDFYCDYDFSKIDIPGDRFSINDGQHYGDVEDSKDFHPATKEQRDTLLKAMTDAGWEFDFEKKELKKIESTNKVEPFDKYEGLTDFERTLADICIGWIGEELGWKQYIKDNANVLLKIAIKKFNSVQDASFEQKSAWSEEDKKMINRIRSIVEKYAFSQSAIDVNGDLCEKIYIDADNWLKSLKDKVQLQPKEWSEEDEKTLNEIFSVAARASLRKSTLFGKSYDYIKWQNWLKSLRDRVQQPKHEWSEEDIRNMQDIDSVLFYDKDLPEETCMRLRNWLISLKPNKDMVEALRTEYEKGRADVINEIKSSWSEKDENTIKVLRNIIRKSEMIDSIIYTDSLKEKLYNWLESIRLQKQWKPSEEQLEALGMATDICSIPEKYYTELSKLYYDLKKLTE